MCGRRPAASSRASSRAGRTLLLALSLGALAGVPACARVRYLLAGDTFSSLPLTEVPARLPGGHSLVFLMSGDGNFSAGVRSLANALADSGYAVIDLNARDYMARGPDAARNGRDAERVIRYYLQHWHRDTLAIVGYSRGADWAPIVAAGLPSDLRSRLRLVAMMSPGRTARYRLFDPFGFWRRTWVPLGPVITGLRGLPMLCVYGADDAPNSVCPELPPGIATVVSRPGGHRARDGAELAEEVLGALGGADPGVRAGARLPRGGAEPQLEASRH